MAEPTLPLELRPAGLPWGMTAGRVVSVGIFIPAKLTKFRQGEELEVSAWERAGAQIRYSSSKKPYVHFYTPKKTEEWEAHVGEHALKELRAIPSDIAFTLPLTGRIVASMRFNLRKPSSYPASVIHATKKPDVDNLSKGILDALVRNGVIEDDNAVTDLSLRKRYADGVHPHGVELELTSLPL